MTEGNQRLADGDVLSGMKAIADALGVPKRQAYHWSYTAGLPTFRIGRTVCARRASLLAWLAKQEAQPTSPNAA